MEEAQTLRTRKQPEPTVGGSTYVRASELPWSPTRFDKVSIKVLYEDKEKREMTCMLKLDPGAYIPFHMHPELEQAYIISGSMHDHDGVARAGDYVWRKPGSRHDNTSEEGAIILAVYRKPNLYYHAAGNASGF